MANVKKGMKKRGQTLLLAGLVTVAVGATERIDFSFYNQPERLAWSTESTTEIGEIKTVVSPDGSTFIKVMLEKGQPCYTAGYYKKEKKGVTEVVLLEKSPLGLHTNIGDFSKSMTLEGAAIEGAINTSYELTRAKVSRIDYKANTLKVKLKNEKKQTFEIEFRVSNNNIAYRYLISQQGETACLVVESEASGFNFPANTTTFMCPQASAQIGWKRTKPSYEEEYNPDEPIGTPSKYGCGYTFPCLFRQGNNGWVLVSETGVTGDYCGSRLSEGTKDGLYTIAFPLSGENNGFGSTGAQMGLPGETPWRTITLGETLQPIVETTVQFDVVEQLYEPSQVYKPGRASWSWIVWQDASMCYNDQIEFINLAANMGWEYILMDALWEAQVGRKKMEELFKIAQSKGVDVFLWYNSNGGWNDAPQDVKQRMDNPIARKAEMKWLKQMGVKGLKVDFFGGDKQETLRLYEAILSDANDYGIQVIFHGCTLPRGWEKMYPNFCSSEAVLASENLIFQQHFNEMEAFNACLHPFIRNTVGSMDFGGTLLNKRYNRTNNGGTTRKTTDIFQLATAVIFQSSVQNFGLTPNNLKEQPAFEIDFMKHIPTTWDEVRFIDGYPGKYIVMARRNGKNWYVAAINAEKETKTITVNLPMMADRKVTYYHDGKDGKTPTMQETKVGKKGNFTLTIPANGGAILTLK